jgi:hypothetical protein
MAVLFQAEAQLEHNEWHTSSDHAFPNPAWTFFSRIEFGRYEWLCVFT